MQHPFDGIIIREPTFVEIVPETKAETQAAQPQGISRRSLLGGLLASFAGAVGVFGGRAQAVEPMGDRSIGAGTVGAQGPGTAGATPQHFGGRDGMVTTYALGEEGSWGRPQPPIYTTQAVGEEGGWWGRPPYGRGPYPRHPWRSGYPRYGNPTTQALGEEGGRGW